ncbi:16S rRNA (guanine(966)-N(2))-methyltransferase RsmD [Desulfoplanes formicivorans]|uniref:Methyltransferase n=1 Tax=Desulfoplanes formicivorans TaxID=1592317 RepID=A0A194ALK0_9BACT|nr:16S rRNA (guanine(966)-N(2))-methyltransferase RsmD [Desulfoplanes formicivorans]GAU09539.1 methyltransferase [Desulfoplanes formicivorans]
MHIITGKYRGRAIKTASGPGYRPATARVRESLFSTLESLGMHWESTNVIDIFAGSGSLALESLSRGAPLAWFIEKNPRAARVIKRNLADLAVDRSMYRVVCKDLFKFLDAPCDKRFSLAFIDPPYGRDLLVPAVDKLLTTGLLAPGALVCAEVEAGVDCSDCFKDRLVHIREKNYGQTRIYIWELPADA